MAKSQSNRFCHGRKKKEVPMEEVVKCPVCNKRIFDLEWKGLITVKIKCFHCRKVVSIKRETKDSAEPRPVTI
ncbi:MAG: hypothetical protein EOM62_14870 [Bacteroidia bacterium]|nr:hypothetical protein [Bacteroidia bacterium]